MKVKALCQIDTGEKVYLAGNVFEADEEMVKALEGAVRVVESTAAPETQGPETVMKAEEEKPVAVTETSRKTRKKNAQ